MHGPESESQHYKQGELMVVGFPHFPKGQVLFSSRHATDKLKVGRDVMIEYIEQSIFRWTSRLS